MRIDGAFDLVVWHSIQTVIRANTNDLCLLYTYCPGIRPSGLHQMSPSCSWWDQRVGPVGLGPVGCSHMTLRGWLGVKHQISIWPPMFISSFFWYPETERALPVRFMTWSGAVCIVSRPDMTFAVDCIKKQLSILYRQPQSPTSSLFVGVVFNFFFIYAIFKKCDRLIM